MDDRYTDTELATLLEHILTLVHDGTPPPGTRARMGAAVAARPHVAHCELRNPHEATALGLPLP